MIEATDMPKPVPSAKDLLMRFTPPVIALSLLAAVTSSVGYSAPTATPTDPRAKVLVQQGQAALDAGQADKAIDAFESALVVEPANPAILVSLAQATRREGMQGKALRYYREALSVDPHNVNAIAGEGAALAEKGAIEKAKLNLAQLEGLCGAGCSATHDLEAAIARGPVPKGVKTAEAAPPAPAVSQN
jgi:tetratricopeptide (TPR) repeat protein